MFHEWHRNEYTVSTEKGRLDLHMIHDYLTTSYWAAGIPFATVAHSIEHSLAFGIYTRDQQIGFARVITDYATFAYIGDVFVLKAFRGQGLSKWLMEIIMAHPELQGLRRWILLTKDAHGLYKQYGFTSVNAPERYMERFFPDVYNRQAAPEL